MRVFLYFLLTAVVVGLTSCRSPRAPMPEPLRMDAVQRPTVIASATARGLVRVDFYDRTIGVHLPYATAENVFGSVLYPPGFPALASQPTALKLAMANGRLRSHGLRLLVLDAYRPPEVHWRMFQLIGSDRFVSDPRRRWSNHTYGRAVDVTLIDAEGQPLRMPSGYDDFSDKAAAAYQGDDPQIRTNVSLLQEVMTKSGFSIYADEWWHFNDLSNPAALTGRPIFGLDLGLPTVQPSGRD